MKNRCEYCNQKNDVTIYSAYCDLYDPPIKCSYLISKIRKQKLKKLNENKKWFCK
jgi:hypothetical protein